MTDLHIDLDYKPHLPPKTDYGIAFVGAGGIVNFAHIPAYRKAGFNLLGCYDLRPEAAEKTARDHGLPRVYPTLDALLADKEVAIVDIAVLPWHQLEIVRAAAAAGKHLLCQKPLSDKYVDAVEIVRVAQQAGVTLAVNHQLRWGSGIRASKALLDEGWLGDLIEAQFMVSTLTPFEYWPWMADYPRYDILLDSIHYIDAFRFLFGEPELVTSRHSRLPGQTFKGETKTISIWDYPDGFQALIAQNAHDWTPDRYAFCRILGRSGWARSTLRSALEYPNTQPDTIEWLSRERNPHHRFHLTLEGTWIPDAFVGPMASLMEAIQTGGRPATPGTDSLGTLRVVEACYRSAAEQRSVSPNEITT
jgi:predicted dehydrogenase